MAHFAEKNAAPPPATDERALQVAISILFFVNEESRNNSEFMKLGHWTVEKESIFSDHNPTFKNFCQPVHCSGERVDFADLNYLKVNDDSVVHWLTEETVYIILGLLITLFIARNGAREAVGYVKTLFHFLAFIVFCHSLFFFN